MENSAAAVESEDMAQGESEEWVMIVVAIEEPLVLEWVLAILS